MNFNIVFGVIIILLGLGIFTVGMGDFIEDNYLEDSKVKLVPCYDAQRNLIQGVTCVDEDFATGEADFFFYPVMSAFIVAMGVWFCLQEDW